MSITLLFTHAFFNFLAVHDTKHLKFKVRKFESHSVFRIEEYSQFCNVFLHIKINKMPWKVYKKK